LNYKRRKYGNKKIKVGHLTFDSKLEKYAHEMFRKFHIEFLFQVEWELMPKYRGWDGKAVRRIYMMIDFFIKDGDKYIFVDTKGYATDTSKLKYKLLGHQALEAKMDYEIHWLKNQKEVKNFVLDWQSKHGKNGNTL